MSIHTVNPPDNSTIPANNRLLATLPRDEYERLLPRLELVRFPKNRILYEAGEGIHYAYFPTHGMASLFAITEDGSTLEIGTVGSEGYIGVPLLHQVGMTAYRVTVQIPMTALRMEANGFLFESNREGTLRTVLSRYAHVVETQLVQAVVCSLTHTVEQRLARRLMVMSDCLEANTFKVTQEQLSIILDRHRNRISEAGIALRNMGLIETARSQLKIIDRQGLEAAACECYSIVKDVVQRSRQS
ncbi:MAG TPA: Crp/Fnr family transcriptional regulator [Pyrinomonadaceae bacterium]|nr:Crp/Fnr family transcriptional regulator [Pyrinomonadaceae bacterium]